MQGFLLNNIKQTFSFHKLCFAKKHVSGIIGCFQLRGQLYGYAP